MTSMTGDSSNKPVRTVILQTTTGVVPLTASQIEQILVLLASGMFEVDTGQVVINKHNAQIQNVEIKQRVYKRSASYPQRQ